MSSPKISILIAVRNEEAHLSACLEALNQLNYPTNQLEILFGDDASSDQSFSIIQDFIQDKPQFHLHKINQIKSKTRGKAAVLTQLSRLARGELFFFTDADTQVTKEWLDLADRFEENPSLGILGAVTLAEGSKLLHHLQTLEWVYAWSLVYTASQLNWPTTVMGNNLIVRREAYEATGGYGQIPFSLTEDFALFWQIIRRGYDFQHVFHQQYLARTVALDTWQEVLQQRVRWMHGAMQLPWYTQVGLWVQCLFLPLLFILSFFCSWSICLGLWGGKMVLQSLWVFIYLKRLARGHLGIYLLGFEFYLSLLWMATLIRYFSPRPIIWKGRAYK